MKIILSRKGFDSASGGYPNIILPDRRLISFPIPDEVETLVKYDNLFIDENTSYSELMKSLGMKDVYKSYVHLDPDIYKNIKERDNNWNALFGQTGSAQSHLQNQGVTTNDIFLFFGWFREVKETKDGYKYINGTDKHIIFGYMQVGEIINIDSTKEYPNYMMEHPHFYRKIKHSTNNTAYVAKEKLSFCEDRLGYGVFNYNKSLVLSKENCNKSIWKLPKYFHPSYNTQMSYHTNFNLWTLEEDSATLESVGRGQEFVLKNNDNVLNWAQDLIINN